MSKDFSWKIRRGTIEDTKKCSYYIIYGNMETGEIWTNQYEDSGSYTSYSSNQVCGITHGRGSNNILGYEKVTKKMIIEFANYAKIEYEKRKEMYKEQ